jgi:hypothetical protein
VEGHRAAVHLDRPPLRTVVAEGADTAHRRPLELESPDLRRRFVVVALHGQRKRILLLGMSTTALGLVLTAIPAPGVPPAMWLISASAVMGIGRGMSAPASSNGSMHLVPDEVAASPGCACCSAESARSSPFRSDVRPSAE